MIYIIMFILMALAAWVAYEIGSAPLVDENEKPKTKPPSRNSGGDD